MNSYAELMKWNAISFIGWRKQIGRASFLEVYTSLAEQKISNTSHAIQLIYKVYIYG
jgi:hypothetical protein